MKFDDLAAKLYEKISKKSGQLPKADDVIPSRKLLKNEPELSKAEKKYTMADMAFKMGDYRAAVFHAKDAIKFNPKVSGPFNIMATCYFLNKQYLEALRILNRGIEFTGSFELYEKIEEVYEAQGNRKQILKMWNDFLRSSKRKDLGYKSLGKFYEFRERNYEKAKEYYAKALEENEVNIDIYQILAKLYFYDKDYKSAAETYIKLLFSKHSKEYFRNSSNKANILRSLGEIFFLNRDFRMAFKYFDMSLQAVPGDKFCYMRLGDMGYYLRDFKTALRYYKLSYQCDETDIEMIVKLAIIQYYCKETKESLFLIKRVQKYNPLLTNVKELVEAIEEKGEAAEENIRGIIEENTDLLLDYKYPDEFIFPESKEDLDNLRRELQSVDAKTDFDDFAAEQQRNADEAGKERERNADEAREEREGTLETEKPLEAEEPLEAVRSEKLEVSVTNQEQKIKVIKSADDTPEEIERTFIEAREKNEKIENKTIMQEKNADDTRIERERNADEAREERERIAKESREEREGTLETEKPLEAEEPLEEIEKPEEYTMETEIKPEANEKVTPEEILAMIKMLENYVSESQEIGRRVIQLKNTMVDGNIPNDTVKQNIVKLSLENIIDGLKNNSSRNDDIIKILKRI